MHTSDEQYLKQFQYEEQSDAQAAAERLVELRRGAAEGDLELPKTSRLIARMYLLVQEELDRVKAMKTPGRAAKFKNWLRALPSDVAAVIAIRECISALACTDKALVVQKLASNIGRLWELETRIREAEIVNPVYMQKIHDQVRENCTTSQSHLRKLYNTAYERIMKEGVETRLTETDLVHLGKFGVQACLDAGLIESRRSTAKGGTLVQFDLTPEIQDFLTNYDDADVRNITDRSAGAMLCPPEPWLDLSNGGYLTARRKAQAPLMSLRGVRNSERSRLRASFTAERMPVVFEAGNYLQAQAFSIHEPTLRAIRAVWEAGGGALGTPTKSGPKKPECPFPEEWVKNDAPEEEVAVFQRWKRSAMQFYHDMRTWRGKVRELGGFLRVADKCGDGPVWFPVYMDKRGRWYYRGSPNPQGSDLAKSVLHFHEKKPLGARGLFWLKVHIANNFGFDKERFVNRAKWTDDNWEAIERSLDSPADHESVWGTDAPWCVYSAAWELREAYRSGNPTEYRTGIVIHMDATCSGLQHFSALLRDPIGGTYVNLTDELQCGPKQDIYGRVAHVALQAIERDVADTDPEVVAMAKWWLTTGIARSLAKKPVMTYVYGATLRGTCEYVQNYVEGELKLQWPEEDKSYKYAQYAASKLFQGIAATVPSAEYAMRWLRDIAKMQPKGKRMEWKTPTGFLVQHDYQAYKDIKIHIMSCGLTSVLVRETTEDTKPLQMQNAVAPNFVHALDASHVTFTSLSMKRDGLSMVGIHDSFGTHPCDVDALHRKTRESFIELYQNRNILGEFLWDVGCVGDAPMRGTLDLTQVLDSEFFFC